MAKIFCVIQIKLNQFKEMSVWSLTYQEAYLSAITATNISRGFYLQHGGKNKLA